MKAAQIALLLGVAAGGLAAGYFAYQHSAMPRPPAAPAAVAAPVDLAGLAGPRPPGSAGGAGRTETADEPASRSPPVPETVPAIALQDMAGVRRPLRDGSGHPHLYNFWATWCEPCRREIPLLNTLQAAYRADHLQVVGVAVDFRDSVRDFLKTRRLNYTLLIGEEDGLEAAQKFGMELNLPFSVFADGQDRIIAVKVGELHREEANAILRNMRALKERRISLAEARADISSSLKALGIARATQSASKETDMSHQ